MELAALILALAASAGGPPATPFVPVTATTATTGPCQIAGVVRVGDEPAAGAALSLHVEPDTLLATTRADEHGRFSFKAPRIAFVDFLVAFHGDDHVGGKSLNRVACGADLELNLIPAFIIEGRVLEPNGAPIAGASIDAIGCAFEDCSFHFWWCRTDRDGRFRALLPGGNELLVGAEGFETASPHFAEQHGKVQHLTIRLKKAKPRPRRAPRPGGALPHEGGRPPESDRTRLEFA